MNNKFNLIITISMALFWGCYSIKKQYKKEAKIILENAYNIEAGMITIQDVVHLPEPVKKYLQYSGAMNKKKIENFRVCFSGGIRKDSASGWMKFNSEQYN